MHDHYQYDDTEFEQLFESCMFPSGLFTHEAHLRLAWIHISRYGMRDAVNNIRIQLVKYVQNLGAAEKYNETLTVAAVKAVYHFMLKAGGDSFKDFIAQHPRLKTNFKGLMAQHYSTDIFNDAAAKKTFARPDLLPFD